MFYNYATLNTSGYVHAQLISILGNTDDSLETKRPSEGLVTDGWLCFNTQIRRDKKYTVHITYIR